MSEIDQTERDDCYFCNSEGPLETHHIQPRRHSGSDNDRNLVDLCPTCHERFERLYDERFYANLGVLSKERQVGLIGNAVTERLEELAFEVQAEIDSAVSNIQNDYVDTDIADARAKARQEIGEESRSVDDSGSQHERIQTLKNIIDELAESSESGAPLDEVKDAMANCGYSERETLHELDQLKQKGAVYDVRTDCLRTT